MQTGVVGVRGTPRSMTGYRTLDVVQQSETEVMDPRDEAEAEAAVRGKVEAWKICRERFANTFPGGGENEFKFPQTQLELTSEMPLWENTRRRQVRPGEGSASYKASHLQSRKGMTSLKLEWGERKTQLV